MRFDWDAAKAKKNLAKHGLSFEEGSEVFGDASAITGDDPGHSSAEHRERTVGMSSRGRVLVVISTRRHDITRLISVRRATPREVQNYESEIEKRFGRG